MRFLPGVVLSLAAVLSVHAEIPELLDQAWTKYVEDIDHWAYTETTRVQDGKGHVTRETVTRYDPSKPYPDQFVVLSHRGKNPIEQMQKWARQRGIERGEKLERPGGVEHDAQPRIILNGRSVLADLEHAKVLEETEQSVTYAIEFHPEQGKNSLVEHFRTSVRVSKATHAFERVSIRLPEPRRINFLAKLRKADMLIEFTAVEASYTPTATRLEDHTEATALFRTREGGHQSTRSDFKRVTPYRERFDVKVGPSRVLDF